MIRFVRTRVSDPGLPGQRLRVDRTFEDGAGLTEITEELVFPEQAHNPDARRVEGRAILYFTDDDIAWLHDVTGELLAELGGDPDWQKKVLARIAADDPDTGGTPA